MTIFHVVLFILGGGALAFIGWEGRGWWDHRDNSVDDDWASWDFLSKKDSSSDAPPRPTVRLVTSSARGPAKR